MAKFLFIALFLLTIQGFGQELEVTGKVYSAGFPVEGALIQSNAARSSVSDKTGSFNLQLPPQDSVTLTVSFLGYQTITKTFNTRNKIELVVIFDLIEKSTVLDEVTIQDEQSRAEVSAFRLEGKTVQDLPSAFGDFTKVLTTLPGVVSNNELSSSYAVRGGSFDENLIYVNDIPIYRPFITTNGQQEGLSFVNPDLVESINFSAGGWQPVYGDRLSSVLNVKYKRPERFHGSAEISLLGGSFHSEGSFANNQVSYIMGLRRKSSQYLLNTLEVDGEYLPRFTDFQSMVSVKLTEDIRLDWLVNFARNRYVLEPSSRETDFGTFTQSLRLFVGFLGQENVQYDTWQNGLKLTTRFSEKWNSKWMLSAVKSTEREFSDVEGGYRLCDVDKNLSSATFNECVSVRGIGTNYNYRRNLLDVNLITLENRHQVTLSSKSELQFGFGYNYQQVDDVLNEYSFIDSADFVNDVTTLSSNANLRALEITAFVQENRTLSDTWSITYGLRFNYRNLNDQLLLSPRVQIVQRPNWKRDVIFKYAVGAYAQQPFYREMRNYEGEVNTDLRAQRSWHFIAGLDYNFQWWARPFKFIAETYYKRMTDIVPYDIDNVRLRYYGENNADAFATGLDLRLSGEFIPGTQSWFSLGLLSVKENVEEDGNGYIRRPTDQRVTAAIFFQDHLPNNPSFRVSISLLFGSGLPFGPPNDITRRNSFNNDSYRRVDIGFIKEFTRANSHRVLLTAEVLNLLGTSNPISYNWISDVNNDQIAVPNALSTRFLNLRLSYRW